MTAPGREAAVSPVTPGRNRATLEHDADSYAALTERVPEPGSGPEPDGSRADPRVGPAAAAGAGPVGGPGHALPEAVRAEHGPRLGWDLSAVRIHHGNSAARSALGRGALAYTVGQHIVFGAGAFDPGSTSGRRLLGHELAHTAQLRGQPPGLVLCQALPDDWAHIARRLTVPELEADVQRLRRETSDAIESSAQGQRQLDQLAAFEAELVDRQRLTVSAAAAVADLRAGVRATAATDPVLGTLLAQHELSDGAPAVFLAGMATSLVTTVPPGAVEDMVEQIMQNPGTFYGNYLLGLPVGLWHGLSNLVTSLVDLVKIAYWLSPAGMVHFATEQLATAAADPKAWLAARQRDVDVAEAIRSGLLALYEQFSADPTVLLQWSADLGAAAGTEMGTLLTEGFLRKTPAEQGRMLGDFMGQVLWEVLLEIVLAVTTVGIGNAIRAGGVLAQGARAGGRLAAALRGMIEKVPALRRFIEKVMSALRGLRKVDDTVDAVQTVERTTDVVQAVEDTADAAKVVENTAEAAQSVDNTTDVAQAADRTSDAAQAVDRTPDASAPGGTTLDDTGRRTDRGAATAPAARRRVDRAAGEADALPGARSGALSRAGTADPRVRLRGGTEAGATGQGQGGKGAR